MGWVSVKGKKRVRALGVDKGVGCWISESGVEKDTHFMTVLKVELIQLQNFEIGFWCFCDMQIYLDSDLLFISIQNSNLIFI